MIQITSFIRSFSISFPPVEGTDISGYVIHACPASELVGGDLIPTNDNLINKGPETSFFFALPENKPAGMWYIKIAAYDTFGLDELTYSDLYSINVASLDPLDQVPPATPTWVSVTSKIEASGQVDNVSITAEWSLTPVPPDFGNYILAYKLSSDQDYLEVFTTEKVHTITNLIAGSSYDFKVKAVDQWNNASDWSTVNSIVAAADTIPPAAVTGLTVTAGMKKVIINFNPVADKDLAGYEVHVSPISGFTPTASTLIASGLDTLYSYDGEVDTNYYVKVRAYDHSGNFSAYSAQASAKTMFVVTQDLVDGIINTAKLAYDSVTSDIIAANAVTATNIADDSITTPKILAGSIVAGKLATNAVVADNIASNAITAGKIAAGAVTAGTIAANAVTASTIQSGAITSDKITTGELITLSAQIKDAIITDAKINTLTASKITTGTLSASTSISVGDSKIKLDGTNSRITVANNAGTITDMVSIGKLNTGNYGISIKDKAGLQVFKVDETGAVIQNLTAGTIDANKVTLQNLVVGNNVTMGPNAYISWVNVTSKPNTTYIDANGIYTGTLTANQVNTSGFVAQTANIGDAAITSAKIGNAQVDTLQIAGNAVTVPVYGEWTTDMTPLNGVDTNTGYTLVIDLSSGSCPVVVQGSVKITLPGSNVGFHIIASVWVVRNGNVWLFTGGSVKTFKLDNYGSGETLPFSFIDPNPIAGINSYSIYVNLFTTDSPFNPPLGGTYIEGGNMLLLGAKR